ncbi:MAG: hypothetical protein CMH30_01925 [Micavibrio sp.]|nr:hypothetical protein [Micavibrio sp.]|tara:strand:+ start:4282 stop:5079 length:798 start_codon:yes stop_codon:yes gene_type:complete
MSEIVPIILCGGIGKRLAPLSTDKRPKQFIQCFSGQSSFQNSLKRAAKIATDYILIICHQSHKSTAVKQAQTLNINNIKVITEEISKNTAVAVALSLLHTSPNDRLIFLPADHLASHTDDLLITDSFKDDILCFGLPIRKNDPNFGYIQHKNSNVIQFIEKPRKPSIKKFIHQGDYLWNSGIYAVQHHILKTAYEEHYPDILNALNDKSILQKLPSISFDKAIIEKSANLAVIESNMLWTDIGSWQSFLYNYCRYSLLGKINDSK